MKIMIAVLLALAIFAGPAGAHHGKGSHRAIEPPISCEADDRLLPGFMFGLDVGAQSFPEPDVVIRATCGLGELNRVIGEAKAEAQAGRNVRIVLPPCIYRERLRITDLYSGSIEIVAEVFGTAVISGADVFVGWVQSDGVWSTDWPFEFGLSWPSAWPSHLPQDELLKRTETFFVNGMRLTQVASFDELTKESFFIDETDDLVFIKTSIDLSNAFVEGTVRRTAIEIRRAENIAIRGVRQQHAASRIQRDAGVWILEAANILLEDMVIRDNSGVGLALWDTEFVTTRRVQFLDNGYSGYSASRTVGLLSEDDIVTGSNWRGFSFGMTSWAIAGFKHMLVHDVIYRRLTATGNLTRGFWLDNDIQNVVIDDSRWCDNLTQGAFLEKVQGPLLIRGLNVCDNVDQGIQVSVAQDITIEDSRIENNGGSQIHFTGQTDVLVTNFETGEQFILNTDFWTVMDSELIAMGDQTILSGPLPPPDFIASGNTCQTDNPTAMDGLICQ